jgi:MtaA/CmuA family methyltransferase
VELTPLERTNRRPNQNILMAFAARYIGSTYDRLAQDYRVLVEGNLRACEAFGIDMVSAISDPLREASAFGAPVVFPHDGVPMCPEPPLAAALDLDRLRPWDPWEAERPRDRLLAIQEYRRRVGGHYPICGWVEGAVAEAADLRGVSQFLEDTALEPEAAHELLEVCTEAAIRFAVAQVEAGADFIGIGDAVASLLSPRAYRVYALPYEQRIIRAVHDAGGRVKLHICGNTSRHLPDMATAGADIIDLDWMVDLETGVRTLGGIAVSGNMDPVAVMRDGAPEEVAAAVRACLAVGGERLIVSAGCEIPVDTPHENLLAHHRALVEAGRAA